MKRVCAFLLLTILLMGVLALPVSAESAASRIDMLCTVNSDGNCQVSMTVNLRLEAAHDSLTFPLPLSARDITMNGSPVSATRSGSAIDVDISRIAKGFIGEATIRFDYTIPEAVRVVKVDDKLKNKVDYDRFLQLTIPMLTGFEYPVENLNFTITMPASSMTFSPEFTSTYRQTSIASDLEVTTRGSQITGYSKAILHDHDGMTMTMRVPETMFPTISTYIREGNPELMPMLIIAGAALVYWILFLFNLPMKRVRTSTPPEGITAGELGCRLTLSGADLTAMVFTWAQLGYILIQLDGHGRVLLHKRMDMGNERSAFDNKIFKLLFGSRRTVDATGIQYAKLCKLVSESVPGERQLSRNFRIHVRIFRLLLCAAQVLCGVCVAMNMTTSSFLQVVLSVILGIFGAVSAWMIQDIAARTHLRGKTRVYLGLGCVAAWILLGVFCGQVWIPLGAALGQWAFGFLAAYGGRRTELGRHNAGMVLGLRSYLKRLPRYDVSRLLNNDPDYFFGLAPYALALGVLKPFSDAFGRRKMEQCPFLVSRIHGKKTAREWAEIMVETADLMDEEARQMQIDQWLAIPNAIVGRFLPKKKQRRRR